MSTDTLTSSAPLAATISTAGAVATSDNGNSVAAIDLPNIVSLSLASPSPTVGAANPVSASASACTSTAAASSSSPSPDVGTIAPVAPLTESNPATVKVIALDASPVPTAASTNSQLPPSVAAATPADPASLTNVSATGELLNGGYKRGGAENDPDTGYYDEIEIEDMEYDEDTSTYTYPCPCGDKFRITKDDLLEGEDIARCPSCSLLIKVIYDPDDLEDED